MCLAHEYALQSPAHSVHYIQAEPDSPFNSDVDADLFWGKAALEASTMPFLGCSPLPPPPPGGDIPRGRGYLYKLT